MSEKQELIKKMIEMQKTFQDYEHRVDGINLKEYYNPPEGHLLQGYRDKYQDMAMKVIDLAHAEKGSHR